jgi:ABC-2 type transport system ATP-binding protein
MHQVEELCDRILLINHGRVILYGRLEEIRRQFSGNTLLVRPGDSLPDLPGVLSREPARNGDGLSGAVRLNLAPGTGPQSILRELVLRDLPVEQFQVAVPTLDEIFIRVVSASAGRGGDDSGAPPVRSSD